MTRKRHASSRDFTVPLMANNLVGSSEDDCEAGHQLGAAKFSTLKSAQLQESLFDFKITRIGRKARGLSIIWLPIVRRSEGKTIFKL